MAQYSPKTWTTGETITAAELNAIEQAAAAAAVRTETVQAVGSTSAPITNAATARPAGAAVVMWLCATGVTPTNAVNGDLIWNA